jgi:uncharacterized protein (DUF58 family)
VASSALQADVVAALGDLELAARLVVEGMRAGPHRSPFRGFSTEFQQHRSYRAGDDLRHLDWKLLARTDRLYTRQFRDTTNMSVMLVVDTSASMGFGGGFGGGRVGRSRAGGAGREGVTKLRYATILAAALAYLAVHEGDAAGLLSTSDGPLTYLPARGGRAHLRSLVARLDRLTPSGAWQPARVIARAAGLLKRRGLIVVLSDFYDAEDETLRELKRATRRGHEVALLHTLARPEITFDYRGDVEFTDLESGATRIVPTDAVGAGYRSAIGDFLTRWRTRAQQHGIDYALFPTDEPPARALRTYVVKRDSRPRHSTSPTSTGRA